MYHGEVYTVQVLSTVLYLYLQRKCFSLVRHITRLTRLNGKRHKIERFLLQKCKETMDRGEGRTSHNHLFLLIEKLKQLSAT
jgi:hypothetical protein